MSDTAEEDGFKKDEYGNWHQPGKETLWTHPEDDRLVKKPGTHGWEEYDPAKHNTDK